MTMNLEKPIGMENFLNELEQMKKHKEAYSRFGVPLPDFCIFMDAGDGRTSLVRYYAKFLRHNEMCEFSGREPFLEFVLDGSMEQMKKVFKAIRDEEGIKNNFQGVIGIDAMKLAGHMGEDIVTDFIDTIKEISKYASVIFFSPRICTRNENRFLETVYDAISNMKIVSIPPYTNENLIMMMKRNLEERSIDLEEDIEDVLQALISNNKLCTAKEVADFAVNLIPYADYSYFIPRLGKEILKEMICGLEMSV